MSNILSISIILISTISNLLLTEPYIYFVTFLLIITIIGFIKKII